MAVASGGAMAVAAGESREPSVLHMPREPTDYAPMSEPMQLCLKRAVRWGKEEFVEPFEEQLK